jgi:hypothetical protein
MIAYASRIGFGLHILLPKELSPSPEGRPIGKLMQSSSFFSPLFWCVPLLTFVRLTLCFFSHDIIFFMKKILLTTLLSTFLMAATAEQVDNYLSISNADEQLVELEITFSQMQNNLNRISQDSDNPQYDMQLLSIRFKSYLQKHLSDNEMEEILQAYKNVLLLQYVSAVADSRNTEPEEMEKYIEMVEADPDMRERNILAKQISQALFSKETIGIMFDNLLKPLLKNAPGGENLESSIIEKNRKAYIERIAEETRKETLYTTRDFTKEELESLAKIVKQPEIQKETQTVAAATAYALEAFFLSLAKRYDINKHQSNRD